MTDKEVSIYINGIQYCGKILENGNININTKSEDIIKNLDDKLADYKKAIHEVKIECIKNYLCGEKHYNDELFDNANYEKYMINMSKRIHKYIIYNRSCNHGSIDKNIIQENIYYDMSPVINKYKNYNYDNLFYRLNKKYSLLEYHSIGRYSDYLGNYSIPLLVLLTVCILVINAVLIYVCYIMYLAIFENTTIYVGHLMIYCIIYLLILLFYIGECKIIEKFYNEYATYLRNAAKINRYNKILEPQISLYKDKITEYYES